MNLIKVQLIGLDQLKKQIDSASNKVKNQIDAEVQASAMEFVALAKRDLSNQVGDTGTLLNSIQYKKETENTYSVFVPSSVYYSGYIEFGTRDQARVPAGLEDVASEFKSQKNKGTLKLIDAIRAWVIRKGIETEEKEVNRTAFAIARSIYENGIAPRPFFYKQIVPVKESLIRRVKTILDGI